jgi:hypothetical protein
MRPAILVAVCLAAGCSSKSASPEQQQETDSCAGIVPASLPRAVDINTAPFDDTPFKDAIIGDGAGALFFTSGLAPVGLSYSAYVFNPQGRPVTSFFGASADSSHPRAIAQNQGFHLLEGSTQNFVRLSAYASDGTLISKTPVTPADLLFGAVDPLGGTLVVSRKTLNPNRTLDYPWYITVQRFDPAGSPRAAPLTVASNDTGLLALVNLGATVTSTGWILVAWGTVDHVDATSADLRAVWVSPDGSVGAPGLLAASAILPGSFFDVTPLAGGGAAIGAGAPRLPITNRWFANLRDGELSTAGGGWLENYPMTRMALVRGGRANALLAGAPNLPAAAYADSLCPTEVSVTLAAKNGKICGALTLPANVSTAITCQSATSTAAVALDGTLVVRTYQQGFDPRGKQQLFVQARLWPKLLQ